MQKGRQRVLPNSRISLTEERERKKHKARSRTRPRRGGHSMEFSHYEEVPAFLAEKIIAAVKAEKEKAEKQ